MTTVGHRRFSWIFMIACLVHGMEAQAQCVEKTEAAGALGGTVHFYICETPGADEIAVGLNVDQFLLDKNTWQQGWSWEVLSDGTSSYFHILRNITSDADFDTTTLLLPVEGEAISKDINTVVHEEAAPQLCVGENGAPLDHLPFIVTADFGNSVTSTLCILNLDESGTFDVSPPGRVTDNIDPGCISSFTVSVNDQPETGGYFEQELVFSVTDMSVADVGSWTVNVTNGVDTFTVEVTIQATGPPQICTCDNGATSLSINASIGSFEQSAACVVSQSELWQLSWERTQPACQVDTNGSPTFNVTANQSQDNPVVYELVFEVDNMTDADIGWWTVTVSNSDGSSQWEVSVEDNGPSLCNTDTPIMEGGFYSDITTNVYIFSSEDLEPSNVNIEQSFSNTSQSTIDVALRPKDAEMLTQEVVLTKYNLTEADIGGWNVTVTNTFSSLQFVVIVQESSGDTSGSSEGGGDCGLFLCIILPILCGVVVLGLIGVILVSKKNGYLCFRTKAPLVPESPGEDCKTAPLHTGNGNEVVPQNGTAKEDKASKKSKSPSKKSRKRGKEQIAYDTVELESPNSRDSEEIVIHNDIYGQTPGEGYPKEEETVIENDVYGLVLGQRPTQGYQPKQDERAKPAAAEYASVNKQRGPPPQPGRLPPINAPNKGKVSTPNTDNEDRDSGSASASSLTVAETGSGKVEMAKRIH